GRADRAHTLYDAATGKELRRFGRDQFFAFRPGHNQIAFGERTAEGGQVRLVGLDDGVAVWTTGTANGPLGDLAFAVDGKRLAFGAGNAIQIVELSGGFRQATPLRGHYGGILSAA